MDATLERLLELPGELAAEPGRPHGGECRRRHNLPAASSVQRPLGQLQKDELVSKSAPGEYRIAEPFLAEWLVRGEL